MLAAGAFALTAGPATTALAKVEGDTIILGSAISLTGKYATNGLHTQRGYDYAAKIINEAGGVKVGGKSYKLAIKYYDDESTPARGAQLAERLIQQDGVEFMLGPYSSGMTKAIAPYLKSLVCQWLKRKVPHGHCSRKAISICLLCFQHQSSISHRLCTWPLRKERKISEALLKCALP